jgi:hypothetical protein
MEIVLVKAQNGTFIPMTTHDKSQAESLKVGEAFKCKVKSMSSRSYQFHKMYFGGLLELAADYFEPSGGLIQQGETKAIKNFIRFLESASGGLPQIGLRQAYKAYITELRQRRALKVAQPELKKHELINLLHEWVKEEAGLYDILVTPTGPRKKIKSISFDKMEALEFDQYFKAAYDVIWRHILSGRFPTQADYDRALNQLMAMG